MNISLMLAALVALGIGAQWLAWRLHQPSILFLLLIGLIIGPITGWFQPSAVLGNMLDPLVSLGVSIILFEGALGLQFREIATHGRAVRNMVTIGPLICLSVIAVGAHLLFELSWSLSFLLGALVCVTGPTVIAPLLRSVRPTANITNILRWEGVLIDPIGAILVVLIFEYIVSDGTHSSFFLFAKIVGVALVLGVLGAMILAFLFIRHYLPDYLRNVFALAFVLLIFTVSNTIEHESGLLTVTILGVALANWPRFPRENLLEFNESLTVLLVSTLFIVLAANVNLEHLLSVGWGGLMLLLIVMFLARPLAVFISTIGAKLKLNEKIMISWVGPRGIVAAAISSLLAIRLQDTGIPGAELLVPLVFLIIIGTVVVQGMGAKWVGGWLKVRLPADNGVLIVGANDVSLMIAQALQQLKFDVVVADSLYPALSKARMLGIRTFYGNPVSEDAERHLDLIGLGMLFAMSTDHELNTLSALYYKHEFGEQNIYRLRIHEEGAKRNDQHQLRYTAEWLFNDEVTYEHLSSMLQKNARIKVTNITASYTLEQFKADNPQAVPLLVVDKTGLLHIVTSHGIHRYQRRKKYHHLQSKEARLVSLAYDEPLKAPEEAAKEAASVETTAPAA